MKRSVTVLFILVLALTPGFSYLSQFSGTVHDHWASPPQWNLNPSINSNIQGSRSVADVTQASFNTWIGAPNAAALASRGSDSTKTAAGNDGTNLICFVCTGDFSKEAETVAVTISTTNSSGPAAGQILDADILFNPTTQFSTDGASGPQDLQTIATHEIGHFFGLDHSAVVRAVMFPFAPEQERTLSYDDVAGIGTVYPGSVVVATNAISGTVRLNGNGVFGAHVFAESQSTNDAFAGLNIRKSPIGTLTLPDGTYRIQGVPADTYVVTAEPLDLPVTNSDVSGYAPTFGKTAVQTNFTTRWH